jgi:peroxiredoxin
MRLAIIAAIFAAGVCAQDPAVPQVPRKSKEFTLVEPSGKHTLLSSLKGKVVVLQFLDTTCPHCRDFSLMLNKLSAELGPKGFQPWGIAFNEADAKKAAEYKQAFGLTFPIGYASRDTVISFLSIQNQLLAVPQVVVIDRKGVVRAQTPPRDEDPIRQEAVLRKLLDTLLKEGAPTSARASTSAVAKHAK